MRTVVSAVTTAGLVAAALVTASPARASASVWPAHGQAAYALGNGRIVTGPRQHTAPIASMAKVMTAYVVLTRHPLRKGHDGFVMVTTRTDVADWHHRVARGESTVPVRAGVRITERQAIAALLLPSANNIAIMLARRVGGSVARFVQLMNTAARRFGMRHTRYTDPSGFAASTRSRPGDQVHMARAAMRVKALRLMVARRTYRVPVAGTVRNTDVLLGRDGFVGIKTGSMAAAGGCFLFLAHRVVRGRTVGVYGVVMGAPGRNLVTAGQYAARAMVRRIGRTP